MTIITKQYEVQGSELTDPLCLVNILSWTTHTSPLCVTLLNSPLLLLSLGGWWVSHAFIPWPDPAQIVTWSVAGASSLLH